MLDPADCGSDPLIAVSRGPHAVRISAQRTFTRCSSHDMAEENNVDEIPVQSQHRALTRTSVLCSTFLKKTEEKILVEKLLTLMPLHLVCLSWWLLPPARVGTPGISLCGPICGKNHCALWLQCTSISTVVCHGDCLSGNKCVVFERMSSLFCENIATRELRSQS